jgi:hypothetical protein
MQLLSHPNAPMTKKKMSVSLTTVKDALAWPSISPHAASDPTSLSAQQL